MRLPKSWSQITLRQFAEIHELQNDKTIGASTPEFAAIERECHIISLLTGVPFDKIEDDKNIALYSKRLSFLKDLPSEREIKHFTHKGYAWKVNRDIRSLSYGEYIDLAHYAKDVMKHLPELMAIFCEPRIFFKIKMSRKKRAEILQTCPIAVVYPLTVFFCNLLSRLTSNLLDLANEKLKQAEAQLKDGQTSPTTGV